MFYRERSPHPALAPFVHTLWYARDPEAVHARQRILPTGRAQIVLSLARDYLTDANHPTDPLQTTSPALYLGLYSTYQHIDAIDLAELMGISFHPGGTLPFLPHKAALFTNCETPLEDLWGVSLRSLRDRLRETPAIDGKFDCLDEFLRERLHASRTRQPHPLVNFSLRAIHLAPHITTVAELSRTTGLSQRRLSQVFREHVGVPPKLYCRIQRFQQAIQQLHRGADLPWSELALACGYYDQSHFANDFRAFSGISPTTYSAATRPWSNHISLD